MTGSALTVSELWISPIKSCAPTRVREARVDVHGLQGDRARMIVDAATGMFVAQRNYGELGIAIKSMCQIVPRIVSENGNLGLTAPDMEHHVNTPQVDFPHYRREVQVWRSTCEALIANDETNHWLTKFLSRERPGNYQLVTMRRGFIRRAKMGYSQVAFHDGYPFLVISQESFDDLQARIGGEPLPMNRRFRPTVVIKGGQPYEEDQIHRMVISGVDLEGMDLCERCALPNIDQETAVSGKEPNRTLATYRRGRHLKSPLAPNENAVYFGRNFNHLSFGTIRVGDPVELR